MARDKRHFVLNDIGSSHAFQLPASGGSTKYPSDIADRAGHAQALLHALDHLPSVQDRPGLYLEVEGRPGEVMITKSLDVSDLTLLNVQPPEGETPGRATIFATESGIRKLRQKIEQFGGALPVKPDGTEKRPRNADLAQSIGAIVEAGLRALWRSPAGRFPAADAGLVPWEVWLERHQAEHFIDGAAEYAVTVASDRIEFPEDTVVIATATAENLALAVRRLGAVRALAVPVTTADYFDDLVPDEQADWVDELGERTVFAEQADTYITLLDTGVSRAHPLIEPALDVADRHAADPAWGIDDVRGHGTQLAGLALYGDLTVALQTMLPISVEHLLESAKIIPDVGGNPHHLLGKITADGIAAVEANATRRRSFVLATTTDQDTPHSGAPTSWSSVLDQLSAGTADEPRLILVSAGNSDQNRFGIGPYLPVADHPDNEIESPAQAWNPICVGAYTEKTVLPAGVTGSVVAPIGDLSPSSRTASWTSVWPIKPDIVMEGGNWLLQPPPPPLEHAALNVLTTSRLFPGRAFSAIGNTSAATALAARDVARLWSDYPDLRPEAVRALYVASARWTPQMLTHLPANPSKGSYDPLFNRYGFGVPDMARAQRSASNALTLIVQDRIVPYRVGKTNAKGLPTQDHLNNEMRVFTLPWPVDALQSLGAAQVTLRVALSTFIEPNPAEAARGFKYRYASHNLRFKLNRADETEQSFMARINAAADIGEESASIETDGWRFGRNRRDVGSLQVDELTCPASDLARRRLLAVHPIAGWWKLRTAGDPSARSARFALIVEIDASELEVDLYAEVEAAIANQVAAQVAT